LDPIWLICIAIFAFFDLCTTAYGLSTVFGVLTPSLAIGWVLSILFTVLIAITFFKSKPALYQIEVFMLRAISRVLNKEFNSLTSGLAWYGVVVVCAVFDFWTSWKGIHDFFNPVSETETLAYIFKNALMPLFLVLATLFFVVYYDNLDEEK